MGYIYKITNKTNQKAYIGKTERSIQERWKEHLRHIPMYCDKLPLYKALAKYGQENFSIEQVEECDSASLNEREIYWINQYDTYRSGYNCTGGGEGGIKDYHECIDEIITRYTMGERLDKLCQEFHCGYEPLKREMEKHGVKINTHAGPKKLSKRVAAINPETKEVVAIYESISAAARAICPPNRNARAICNHISRYKDMPSISHGFYWKTKNTIPNIDEL